MLKDPLNLNILLLLFTFNDIQEPNYFQFNCEMLPPRGKKCKHKHKFEKC